MAPERPFPDHECADLTVRSLHGVAHRLPRIPPGCRRSRRHEPVTKILSLSLPSAAQRLATHSYYAAGDIP